MAIAGSQSTGRKSKKSVRSASTKRSAKRSKTSNGSKILGKIGAAYVPPSSTTMATCSGPFSASKFVNFLYENELTKINPGLTFWASSHVNNDMFDFDKSGYYGNKQPLYYDSLLSGTGPYKAYKVISWKTTFTVVNASTVPVTVWVAPALTAAGEVDTAAEADNFPGVKKLFLTEATGSHQMGTITVTGHIDDVFNGFEKDLNMLGAYNTGPGSPIYGSLLAHSADGVANAIVYVAVRHEAYTELLQVDSLVS